LAKDAMSLTVIVDLKHSKATPTPHNWLALAPGVHFLGCCQARRSGFRVLA